MQCYIWFVTVVGLLWRCETKELSCRGYVAASIVDIAVYGGEAICVASSNTYQNRCAGYFAEIKIVLHTGTISPVDDSNQVANRSEGLTSPNLAPLTQPASLTRRSPQTPGPLEP